MKLHKLFLGHSAGRLKTVFQYLNGKQVEPFIDCGTQSIDAESAHGYLDEPKSLLGDTLGL